jgi:L-cystine uptake protein TcyP (sodium:dicarboxylate symporter family)
MQEQNLKNHAQFVPMYHIGLTLLILAAIIGSIIKLWRSYSNHIGGLLVPAILLIISIALLLTAWYARVFALKAQDRAIRAEENLRYFAITGNLLDSKLTIQQIIALRFANNNEFLDLAHKAVAENLSPKQIKDAVKNWKADHHRV